MNIELTESTTTNDSCLSTGNLLLADETSTGWGKVMKTTLAAAVLVGTAGDIDTDWWNEYEQGNVGISLLKIPASDIYKEKTAQENIALIRGVFSPTVSELARVFGVSRQAIYNWAGGERPNQAHFEKINKLASAAESWKDSGYIMTSRLLKRKIMDGKSLFELAYLDDDMNKAVQVLIQRVGEEQEQKERLAKRFVDREPVRPNNYPAANDMV